MKVIDFFRRVAAAGVDVTKISYRIKSTGRRDMDIRSIVFFDGVKLTAKRDMESAYDVVDRFLYQNDYEIKLEDFCTGPSRRTLVNKASSKVLVTFIHD